MERNTKLIFKSTLDSLCHYFQLFFRTNNDKKVSSYTPYNKLKHYKNELKNIYFDSCHVCRPYDRATARTIKEIKYAGWQHKARVFQQELINTYRQINFSEDWNGFRYIVYPPVHWTSYFWRGENHAKCLAKTLIKWLKKYPNIRQDGHTTVLWVFRQPRRKKQQAKKSRNERLTKEIWAIKSKNKLRIEWAQFIIVDDVISTWSTINSLSKLLKSHWATRVDTIIIASGRS